jgi:hypothetical protein
LLETCTQLSTTLPKTRGPLHTRALWHYSKQFVLYIVLLFMLIDLNIVVLVVAPLCSVAVFVVVVGKVDWSSAHKNEGDRSNWLNHCKKNHHRIK